MPRPRNIIPTVNVHLMLPVDVHQRLTALLFSDLELRVPVGKTSAFVAERLREYFDAQRLDLAPYTGVHPGVFFVSADKASMEVLINKLRGIK